MSPIDVHEGGRWRTIRVRTFTGSTNWDITFPTRRDLLTVTAS